MAVAVAGQLLARRQQQQSEARLPVPARLTYTRAQQVHKLCQQSAERILNDFSPNLMIAIGGGGYVPARILRSFLKKPGSPNIPIQAIGLSLYESLGTDTEEEAPGTKVTRTQWLDLSSLEMANLIGKNVLIVDEVDDTRTTLEYAVRELQKDVEIATEKLGRGAEKTKFSIFVLHNKDKTKKGSLPKDMHDEKRYCAAVTVGDVWICYPWEAQYVHLLFVFFSFLFLLCKISYLALGVCQFRILIVVIGTLRSMTVWPTSRSRSLHSSSHHTFPLDSIGRGVFMTDKGKAIGRLALHKNTIHK